MSHLSFLYIILSLIISFLYHFIINDIISVFKKIVSHVKLRKAVFLFSVILNNNAYCHTIIPVENFSKLFCGVSKSRNTGNDDL